MRELGAGLAEDLTGTQEGFHIQYILKYIQYFKPCKALTIQASIFQWDWKQTGTYLLGMLLLPYMRQEEGSGCLRKLKFFDPFVRPAYH